MSFVVGASLAYADFAQANTIKVLAADLRRDNNAIFKLSPRPPAHWYYLADTFDGSQPYVEPLGWENVFPNQVFKKGDLLLRSRYRKSSWWALPSPERFELIAAYNVTTWLPLRVMDVPASAGFYASCWGALPYVFTNHPLERFELTRVRE